jgi:hypothetical protein
MKNSELEQLINEKLNSAAISDYAQTACRWKGARRCKKSSPA